MPHRDIILRPGTSGQWSASLGTREKIGKPKWTNMHNFHSRNEAARAAITEAFTMNHVLRAVGGGAAAGGGGGKIS